MVLKAAVQALKKADVLKAQAAQANANIQSDKSNCTNILLNDSTTWSTRQQLTTALHQVLVLDLDYALDQKVEQELWTHGFKNYIATLQTLLRDKKNPKRSELQALLSWCLESASGFYLTLFQELCEAFQLDLPFRRRGIAYGCLVGRPVDQPAIPPQRSSCLYICQYCLVHLGDIARYRNQRKQAENFYKQAILLSPSSGQPYNQLALLQASRGDRLSTVFYYVRSVTLLHPFPPAATNLSKTLEMVLTNDSKLESRNKITVADYTTVFLKLHGLLQTGTDLNKAETIVKTLISTLTALSATQSFGSHRLIQMLAINLYALREAVENFKDNELSSDELQIKELVLDIIAGSLNAFLLPVYTLKAENLLEYHSLPTIKLILEWLKIDPKHLESKVFTSRLQIWPSLCLLLNTIQPLVKDMEEKKYLQIPLPEDRELQGFLPLDEMLSNLNYTSEECKGGVMDKLRAVRLIQLGQWLATKKINGNYLITTRTSNESEFDIFEPVSKQESDVSDLLKELEQISINETNSIEESQEDDISNLEQPVTKAQQRLRTGILKPQGSLERAREEREQALLFVGETKTPDPIPIQTDPTVKVVKKVRQNVAMQAILKKVEENSKQVKFQTEKSNESNLEVKEDLASKKGVLSLKNQSGYPHLTEAANAENPIIQNPIKKFEPQPPTTSFPQQYANFPTTLPSNNTNFPINYPPNYNLRPNITNYRNVPDFVSPDSYFNKPPPTKYPTQNFEFRPNMPPPKPTFDYQKFNNPYMGNPVEKVPEMYQNFPPQKPWNPPVENKISHPSIPTWWNNTGNSMYSQNPYNSFEHFNQIPFPKEDNSMRPWNSIPPPAPPPNLPYHQMMQPSIGNPGISDGLTHRQKIMKENKKMHKMDSTSDSFEHLTSQPPPSIGYSLFSSNWGMTPNTSINAPSPSLQNQPEPNTMLGPQSLFSGPGLSPLERLLEQQKQLRGAPSKPN